MLRIESFPKSTLKFGKHWIKIWRDLVIRWSLKRHQNLQEKLPFLIIMKLQKQIAPESQSLNNPKELFAKSLFLQLGKVATWGDLLKKLLLNVLQCSMLGSLFNEAADLNVCIFIRKRLKHGCFHVNIAKFLRASILKNICKRLLLNLKP